MILASTPRASAFQPFQPSQNEIPIIVPYAILNPYSILSSAKPPQAVYISPLIYYIVAVSAIVS